MLLFLLILLCACTGGHITRYILFQVDWNAMKVVSKSAVTPGEKWRRWFSHNTGTSLKLFPKHFARHVSQVSRSLGQMSCTQMKGACISFQLASTNETSLYKNVHNDAGCFRYKSSHRTWTERWSVDPITVFARFLLTWLSSPSRNNHVISDDEWLQGNHETGSVIIQLHRNHHQF